MRHTKSDDSGFTGLEAAIVLIAFVVVAAVFSYVVLGAGFFTTQKSQETVYKGVEQATSNIQMIGQVYATNSGKVEGNTVIKGIQFNLGLAPGAPSIDMTKMIIVVSQPGSSGIAQLTYGTAGTDHFSVTDSSDGTTALPTLSGQKQGTVNFDVSPGIRKNGQVNIELRPAVGAALPFTRTAPATIQISQILY